MTRQAAVNDRLINYFYYPGNSEKPALVFLHGWRSEGAVWYNSVKLLKESADVGDIYCLDLPGFGASPAGQALKLDDYCSTVSGFLDKLGLRRAILIGHSFGGRIAIKLAGTDAKRLVKIVLVDSAGLIHNKLWKSLISAVAKLAKPIFWPKFMRPIRSKIYWLMGAEDYVATPQLNKTFVQVIGEDLAPYLERIALPTLIIWGENDFETPIDDAKFMAKRIPGAELKTIKNAGHLSFLDQPEKFISYLKDFVS